MASRIAPSATMEANHNAYYCAVLGIVAKDRFRERGALGHLRFWGPMFV